MPIHLAFPEHSESNPAATAEIRLGCLSSSCTSWFPLAANSSERARKRNMRHVAYTSSAVQTWPGMLMGTQTSGHTVSLTAAKWSLHIFQWRLSLLILVNKNKYMHETTLLKAFLLGTIRIARECRNHHLRNATSSSILVLSSRYLPFCP